MKEHIKVLWTIWCGMLTVSVFAKILVILAVYIFEPALYTLKWLLFVVGFIFLFAFFFLVYKHAPLIIGTKKQIIFSCIYTIVYFGFMLLFWEAIKGLKFDATFYETLKLVGSAALGP